VQFSPEAQTPVRGLLRLSLSFLLQWFIFFFFFGWIESTFLSSLVLPLAPSPPLYLLCFCFFERLGTN